MLLIKQKIKIYKILNLLYIDSVGFSLLGPLDKSPPARYIKIWCNFKVKLNA